MDYRKLGIVVASIVVITGVVAFVVYKQKVAQVAPPAQNQEVFKEPAQPSPKITTTPVVEKVETFDSQKAFEQAYPEFKGIQVMPTSASKTL